MKEQDVMGVLLLVLLLSLLSRKAETPAPVPAGTVESTITFGDVLDPFDTFSDWFTFGSW